MREGSAFLSKTVHLKNVFWISDNGSILKGIDWDVQAGEHWAVIGLNGSGKTSLLNVINGFVWPSKGVVSVLGNRFGSFDIRELRKSIGWVSTYLQERLYGTETALEIVLSGRFATIGLYERPKKEERAKALRFLKEFGCRHLASHPYSTLSQGEKQKVLLARALMGSPKILILDEPCEGLDIFSREQVLSIIGKLGKKKNPPAMFYVSHRVEEILPVFSHTLLLRKGNVFSSGRTREMLTSKNLSEFFERKVKVQWEDGRARMQVVKK